MFEAKNNNGLLTFYLKIKPTNGFGRPSVYSAPRRDIPRLVLTIGLIFYHQTASRTAIVVGFFEQPINNAFDSFLDRNKVTLIQKEI